MHKYNSLDIVKIDENTLSAKDLSHEMDFSNSKWDFLFNKFINITDCTLFWGWSLNYSDNKLSEVLNFCAENMYVNKKDNLILFKAYEKNILINRASLIKLWNYYEQCSLIFIKREYEDTIIDILKTKVLQINLLEKNNIQFYVLSKSFEDNVVFIYKSHSYEFP